MPFLWGAGGAKLTPEEIALQRSVLARRKAQGVDVSPIGSPLQGLARVVDALGDRYQEGQLNDAAAGNAQVNQDILASLLGGNVAPPAASGVTQSLSPTATPIATDPIGEVLAAAPTVVQSNGEWLRYANQGATRNKPLDEKLVAALSFLPELGVTAEVFSGGQDAEGPNRTGSRRHDHGGAGDFRFYKDGRQLDWSKPEDLPLFQQIVQKGKASGITGFGAGPGYMGQGTMHVGFGSPSVWGAGGKGENAPDWLRQAYAGSPSAVRQGGTVAAPQVAQAQNIAPTNSLGVSPAVIQALTSPYANEQTKGVAQLLLQQQQGQASQQQKLALAEQQRQQEIARRQAIAQQTGIDPAYAADDDIWKAATGERFAAPSTSIIGSTVIDNRTKQPIYQGKPDAPTSVQEFEYGQQNPDYFTRQEALRRSGAPTTEGAIPAGYQANRDANGRVISISPLAGSPAAFEESQRNKSTDKQAGQRSTSTDVVTNAGVRAVQALSAGGLPATGSLGRIMSNIPESNAAEVRRQVATLKANASASSIQAMREASPTGAALGGTSDKDVELLANKAGALDPDSPNFDRDVKDYVKTQLEIIHGPEAGRKIFEGIDWSQKAQDADQSQKRLKYNPSTGELE